MMVMAGSIMALVIMMESTPDSGVAIRKDEVAPLEAPDFLRATAAGMTEQEHRGRGMPRMAAQKTELVFCAETTLLRRSAFKT